MSLSLIPPFEWQVQHFYYKKSEDKFTAKAKKNIYKTHSSCNYTNPETLRLN